MPEDDNPFEADLQRAISLCDKGEFAEAETLLATMQSELRSYGLEDSPSVTHWLEVARSRKQSSIPSAPFKPLAELDQLALDIGGSHECCNFCGASASSISDMIIVPGAQIAGATRSGWMPRAYPKEVSAAAASQNIPEVKVWKGAALRYRHTNWTLCRACYRPFHDWELSEVSSAAGAVSYARNIKLPRVACRRHEAMRALREAILRSLSNASLPAIMARK